MSTAVLPFQYDDAQNINYTGAEPDYYGDGGPVVITELHTARVSGHDLDALELASDGKLVLTTNATNKALDISAVGIVDPAVVDTTVVDAGDRHLHLASGGADCEVTGQNVTVHSAQSYYSTVAPTVPDGSTFHHHATDTAMVIGTGTLDANNAVVSGAFLRTTPASFTLAHDTAVISSESEGAGTRLRYESQLAHEFFVGADAAAQTYGAGALEITPTKVIIRKDLDIVGTVNSVATDSTTLQVQDQIIRLAHSDDPATKNRDVLLSQSPTGLAIDTVPGSYVDDAAYMSAFTDADGAKLFVDDDAQDIDVTKAAASGVFSKEFAFYLNDGAKAAGQRTDDSRMNEPYWRMKGGALRMSHCVPEGNGSVKNFDVSWRFTNDGDLEMVRITRVLQWDPVLETYVESSTVQPVVSVMATYVAA